MTKIFSTMKHHCFKSSLLSLALLLCSTTSNAYDFEMDGIFYNIISEEDKTVEVTFGNSYEGKYTGSVVIPAIVPYNSNSYLVTTIGEYAFNACSDLTSITIPNSVSSMGCSAFEECLGLTSVHVSDIASWCNIKFETVSSNPLYYAHNLYLNGEEVRDLSIPYSVTKICGNAFAGCATLLSVTIPNSVTGIEHNAFYECTNLLSVNIQPSVKSIGNWAFAYCHSLSSINIPNSVNYIGEWSFHDCRSLISLFIPNSVNSIGEHAFDKCSSLVSIYIPNNSVTKIEAGTFRWCSSLTSITIPNSVTRIETGAFENCSSLVMVVSNPVTAPILGYNNVFDNIASTPVLYIPKGSKSDYNAKGWLREFHITKECYVLNVSSVGYATLYLDYSVKIPEGVEVYVASELGKTYVKLTEVNGVLPANTGVIVRADEGEYFFTTSDATPTTIGTNLLKGTAVDTQIATETGMAYYVLSCVDDVVGMYKAKITDGKFLNNANKAYIPVNTNSLDIYDDNVNTETDQLGRKFLFDFGDETGIIETENGGHKTKNPKIYDLFGHRVHNLQRGVYIVNGRKVMLD